MKSKRKLKGMTLIEVVISIGIYAVIALLLTEIMSLVNATMKATNQLNRRLAYEAKFADNMLLSDGKTSWADARTDGRTQITVSLSSKDAAPSGETFAIPAFSGFEYMVNADNLERGNGKTEDASQMLINPNTNYRFMVFTKENVELPDQPDVFTIRLNMQRDSGHTGMPLTDPITKIIINGLAYKLNDLDHNEAPVTQQTITDEDLTGINDQNKVSINPKIKDRTSAGELLTIDVPEKKDDGTSRDQTGSIDILIFTKIRDDAGHTYEWTNSSDRATLGPLYKNLDLTDPDDQALVRSLDNGGAYESEKCFPATERLTLDYSMYDHNVNTDRYSYYGGITYTWNPDFDPKNPDGNTPRLSCEVVRLGS